MSDATQMISGLSSGIDWRTMVDQLINIERRTVVNVENQQSKLESQKDAWQELNTKLQSFKTAVAKLADEDTFLKFQTSLASSSSTAAGDIISVSVGSDGAIGTFSIEVQQLASSEKLSSATFSSTDRSHGHPGQYPHQNQSGQLWKRGFQCIGFHINDRNRPVSSGAHLQRYRNPGHLDSGCVVDGHCAVPWVC